MSDERLEAQADRLGISAGSASSSGVLEQAIVNVKGLLHPYIYTI
jgi:hypothetical protein